MNKHTLPSKDPTMKHSTLFILLSIVITIVAILALPWYTRVTFVNDYFYSVSRAGVETFASIPAITPLVAIILFVLVHPRNPLAGTRKQIVFFAGLIVALYATFYYCAMAFSFGFTPGFGALLAVIGGMVLMLICIFNNEE